MACLYGGAFVRAAVFVLLVLPVCGARADDARGTAEEAQVMVGQAISYFDEVGRDKAFAKFNDDPAPLFRDGDLYIFVYDGAGVIVAHAADTSLLGVDASAIQDVDGKSFGQEILDVAGMDGAWIDYKWKDPVTGKVEPKSSWVVLHDGYVFGAGIYKP